MQKLLKPLHILYVVYAFVLFAAFMIPVFIWALTASLFGRVRGGNLVYRACTVWADVWLPLIGIFHRNIYRQKPRPHQPYIFVANHISYLDSAVLPRAIRQPLRPLGKVEMAKIPVFGTIYRLAIITVDRSSPANRVKSVQVLKAMLQKEISILVFPEGTFNTTGKPLKEFYDGAFRIAIETGTPIMPILFLDTYARMHYRSVFSLSPGRSRAVFLPEVPVTGLTLEDVASLREKIFHLMEEELVKQNADWITASAKR